MSAWPTVRLGAVASTSSGSTPSRGNPEYFEGNVPWAKIQDLTRAGMWLHTTEEHVSDAAVVDCRLTVHDRGTVLLAMYASIGTVSIAAGPTTSNQAILGIRPSAALSSEYLWLLLRHYSLDLARLGRGGTQANINASIVRDIQFPLPPLEVQQRTAASISSQLGRVEVARTAALGREAAAATLKIRAIEGLIGDTARWQTRRLKDVAHIQLGKMLSPASRTGRRPMPYLRNANVQWDRFELSEVHEMDFDEREEAKFLLRRGDVLVCEGGEPGRAAVWDGQLEPCLYQKALHRLRPISDSVDPQYLVYRLWLSAMRGEFTNDHAQTTIAHLPAIRLAELQIATPPIAKQRQIVAALREQVIAIDSISAAIEAELKAIEALPAALLRNVFNDLAA